MSKRIIGIGGRLRSGKDTVADYLVERYGFTKLGMSDPLLKAALVLDPIVTSETDELNYDVYPIRLSEVVETQGYVAAKEIPEVRRFLQVLGTDFGRYMIGENVWVNMAANAIAETEGDVVITGLRFPNETQMIGDLNGETWWIDRSLTTDEALARHASENGVNSRMFDLTIENTGTLEGLYLSVDTAVGNPNS